MARRTINVVPAAAVIAVALGWHALGVCASAQSINARVAVAAPPAPVAAPPAPARPRAIAVVAAPVSAPRLSDAPTPATFSRSYSVSGSNLASPATATFSADRASGGFYSPDTQLLYVNYADAARAEFEALSAAANRAAFGDAPDLTYTLHNAHLQAAFSMGGGDVQMSQPSLYSLTRAAAVAEAGVDISTPDHRFGLRVQGRAIVNQPLVLSLPVVHEINVLVPEYPSVTAYIHF